MDPKILFAEIILPTKTHPYSKPMNITDILINKCFKRNFYTESQITFDRKIISISKIKATGHGNAVSCCFDFVAYFFEFSIISIILKVTDAFKERLYYI